MKQTMTKLSFPFGLPSTILQTNNSMEMLQVHYVVDGFYETKEDAFTDLHELAKLLYPKFMLALHYFLKPPSFNTAMNQNEVFRVRYVNEENFHYFQEYMAAGFEELFQSKNYIPGLKKFRWVVNSNIVRENTEWDSTTFFFFPNAEISGLSSDELQGYYDQMYEIFDYIKEGLISKEITSWIKHTAIIMMTRLCPNFKNKIVLQSSQASCYGQDYVASMRDTDINMEGEELHLF